MPPLRIPSRYLAGLKAVDRLTDDQVDAIIEALREVPRNLDMAALAREVGDALRGAPTSADELLEAVLSLVIYLPEESMTATALATEVSESDDLELVAEHQPAFALRLAQLMDMPALRLAARAAELVMDHEQVFHGSRIFTDIRPVFAPVASEGVKAATVTATLKIDYHPNGKREIEIATFAMGKADLLHLRETIDRALKKTEQLERLVHDQLGVPYWAEEGHSHGTR